MCDKGEGGGVMMNQAIHTIDQLLWVAGPVTAVHSSVACLGHQRMETEDTAVAILEFANGARGVIEGTTIPWEVAPSLKVHELVNNHTTFYRPTGLYTQTFAVSMNKASYDKLPADLKKVIDNNSGLVAAAMFGKAMDEGDKEGRAIAEKAGNRIVTLDAAETQRWRRTASTVADDWLKEVKSKGIDGDRLLADAKAAIAKYNK